MKKVIFLGVYLASLFFGINITFGQKEVPKETWIELQNAIKSGNEKKLKALIDNGANFDYVFGYDPYKDAIANNHIGIVKMLFDNGERSYGAVKMAIRNDNIEMLRFFIEKKFNMADYLVNACENNSLPMVKLMVEAGSDVNKEQKRRKGIFRKYYVSPIQMAVRNNNLKICTYLINQDVDPKNTIDEAFKENKNRLIKSIVEKGLYKDYNVLIFSAVSCGDLEMVELSIEKGADKDAKDITGKTIFLAAVASGNSALSKYCIETLKANPLTLTNTNESALMLAAENGNEDLVSYVISLGVDIKLENNNGETAAFYALKNKSSIYW